MPVDLDLIRASVPLTLPFPQPSAQEGANLWTELLNISDSVSICHCSYDKNNSTMNNYNKFSQDFQLKIVKGKPYHDDLTDGLPSGRRKEMRQVNQNYLEK